MRKIRCDFQGKNPDLLIEKRDCFLRFIVRSFHIIVQGGMLAKKCPQERPLRLEIMLLQRPHSRWSRYKVSSRGRRRRGTMQDDVALDT